MIANEMDIAIHAIKRSDSSRRVIRSSMKSPDQIERSCDIFFGVREMMDTFM
jgi:hypothetical protein